MKMRSKNIDKVLQLMSRMRFIGLGCRMLFILSFFHFFITSCSSELEGPGTGEEKGTPIQIVGYVPSYMEDAPTASPASPQPSPKERGTYDSQWSTPKGSRAGSENEVAMVNGQWSMVNGLTRTEWTPPTGYSLHTGEGTTAVGAFFTTSPSTSDPRRIYYHTTEGKWYVSGADAPAADTYYLYGYVPYNAANVSITPNDTYAKGATLTFNNMKSVMTKDICVIVGAKDGTSETEVTGLQPGKFSTTLKAADNYLFLLCEHLYAKLEFSFRVGTEYATLRKIKLRKVELMGYTYTLDNLTDITPMKETGNFTVNLTANNTGESPLGDDVILFTPNGSSDDLPPVLLFESEDGVQLPADSYTTETAYVPYFNLSGAGKICYKLRTTYDVYDRKDNLTRKGCVAENLIVPKERFNKNQLQRGYQYTLQLTVMPTYLYVLSEPDLDNPSVVWE